MGACICGFSSEVSVASTGVGESKQLTDDKTDHFNFAWLPDSKSIVYSAAESGHPARSYLLDTQGGTPRHSRPRARLLVCLHRMASSFWPSMRNARAGSTRSLGGEPVKLNFVPNPDERIMAFFDQQEKSAGAHRYPLVSPVKVTRVDIATGRREPFKEIMPADPAGVQAICNPAFQCGSKVLCLLRRADSV